jgi:hypothetical protein
MTGIAFLSTNSEDGSFGFLRASVRSRLSTARADFRTMRCARANILQIKPTLVTSSLLTLALDRCSGRIEDQQRWAGSRTALENANAPT